MRTIRNRGTGRAGKVGKDLRLLVEQRLLLHALRAQRLDAPLQRLHAVPIREVVCCFQRLCLVDDRTDLQFRSQRSADRATSAARGERTPCCQ